MIIIGNKCDLTENRKVKSWELEDKAKEKDCPCFETSAKDNINIDESINFLINEIINKNVNNSDKGIFSIDPNKKDRKYKCVSCSK